jgi:CO dehydrogenase nickel-insertion accessory protein CooC1
VWWCGRGGTGGIYHELLDRDFSRVIAVDSTKHLGQHLLVGVNGRDVTVGAAAPIDGNAIREETAAIHLHGKQ